MLSSTSRREVHVRAPGKVNVYLAVGALQDDGYHDVAIAYQALSLSEDVRVSHADGVTISVSGSVELSRVPLDESNIAMKAARLLAEHTGYTGGAHIDIEKHVPVTGGMGGGSADAAATLLALDQLWETHVPREQMLRLARRLGADVPFALTGGTAIGTGRGDELSPALAQGTFHWVLALADFGLSTPAVYGELDAHRERHAAEIGRGDPDPSVPVEVLQALRAGDARMLADAMSNDLQVAALHLEPGLTRVLELGESNGALAGIVSGSGPTVAFLVESSDAALELQVALSAAQLEVVRATGPVHGARVIND